MGVLELLRKITKYCAYKFTLSAITTRTKVILGIAVLIIIKYIFKRAFPVKSIPTVPISEFLS